jgi:hypothetical protein
MSLLAWLRLAKPMKSLKDTRREQLEELRGKSPYEAYVAWRDNASAMDKKEPKPEVMRFNFIVVERGEPIPPNIWYQPSDYANKSFVKYNSDWDIDWKWSPDGIVKVAGISYGTRARDFLSLAGMDDFDMHLEDEPDNPVDRYAKKVMACATMDGQHVCKHVGYLPRDVSQKYKGIEVSIRPRGAFVPQDTELNLGIEVALLVRNPDAEHMKARRKKGGRRS